MAVLYLLSGGSATESEDAPQQTETKMKVEGKQVA
jgi:hypothetical protein